MRNLVTFLLVYCMVIPPAFGAKKTKFFTFEEPDSHLMAVALKNHLKRVQTIGGFLVWIEKHGLKKEVVEVRKWLAQHNVAEDQYFPEFQARQNTIRNGRVSLTINKENVTINGKTYGFSNKTFVQHLDQFCKDQKCFDREASLLETTLMIQKAEAGILVPLLIGAGLLTVGFLVVVGMRGESVKINAFSPVYSPGLAETN